MPSPVRSLAYAHAGDPPPHSRSGMPTQIESLGRYLMTPRLGLLLLPPDDLIRADCFEEIVAIADECGAESLWTAEHVVVAEESVSRYPYPGVDRLDPSLPMPDPLEVLAFIAGISARVLLGTAVVIGALHSPAILAKRAATIDRLSGERLILGLGVGWQSEEYAAVGVPYEGRGARLEECIEAMRELWSSSPASYRGKDFVLDNVHSVPRPLRRIPIHLGGNSDRVLRRVARLADGWYPISLSPEEFGNRVDLLRRYVQQADRDPEEVEITAYPASYRGAEGQEAEIVRRYVDRGASRIIFSPNLNNLRKRGALRAEINEICDKVMNRL